MSKSTGHYYYFNNDIKKSLFEAPGADPGSGWVRCAEGETKLWNVYTDEVKYEVFLGSGLENAQSTPVVVQPEIPAAVRNTL